MSNPIHQQHIENRKELSDLGLVGFGFPTGLSEEEIREIENLHTTSTIKILEKIEEWAKEQIIKDTTETHHDWYNEAISDLLSHLSEAKELIANDK